MEMKMKAHCGGDELQIGTNTKVWGKLDGDHNTNRKKKKPLRPWFFDLMKTKAYLQPTTKMKNRNQNARWWQWKQNVRRWKVSWRQWCNSKMKPKAQVQKVWKQRHKKDMKTKKLKSLNLKLEPKPDFWEMLVLVLVLNLNHNRPNRVWLSPFF